MADPDRSAFLDALDKRLQTQDKTAERFGKNIDDMAENIGRRLAATLGADPDDVFPRRGNDGRNVGNTDFERNISGLGEAARIKAAVLSTSMAELEEFVNASGMERGTAIMSDGFKKLAGLAEESAALAGIPNVKGSLDTAAATALMGGYVAGRIAEDLVGNLSRASAQRIRGAMISNLGNISLTEMASRIAEEEKLSVGRATTEARTRMAEADRFANQVVADTIDPDGEDVLLCYMGPQDGITRKFCDLLVGKAFTTEEFEAANNHQTATHPRISGGGYNCRHAVTPMPNSPAALEAMGIERGSAEDVAAASAAAKAARKKKKRRR